MYRPVLESVLSLPPFFSMPSMLRTTYGQCTPRLSRDNLASYRGVRYRFLWVLVALLTFAGVSWGQVAPGLPSLSAFDSHQVDTVNLMNGDILIHIPVLSKSGMFPFEFALDANSQAPLGMNSGTRKVAL